MKLKPLGWRVLVKPVDLQDAADVAIPDSLKGLGFQYSAGLEANDKRRAEVALEQGTVVAIGPNAFHNRDWEYGDDWVAPVKVGDKVWFGKYAGKLIPDPEDGVEYMLLLDEDLQCIIEG